MTDYISRLITQHTEKINKKRDEELLIRIKRYDPEFNLIDESQKIFPRIAMRLEHDGTEKWYWNNNGHAVLILTVKHLQHGNPFHYNEEERSFNLSMQVDFI